MARVTPELDSFPYGHLLPQNERSSAGRPQSGVCCLSPVAVKVSDHRTAQLHRHLCRRRGSRICAHVQLPLSSLGHGEFNAICSRICATAQGKRTATPDKGNGQGRKFEVVIDDCARLSNGRRSVTNCGRLACKCRCTRECRGLSIIDLKCERVQCVCSSDI